MRLSSCAVVIAAGVLGCQARPPASWVQGGARLEIPRARWTRGGHLIDIMPDGRVLADGEHVFSVDAAGRVFDPDGDPIGVLAADGRLLGNNNAILGKIGVYNAAPPGREVAWLALSEQGEVLHFDRDGDKHEDGGWEGCGAAVRTCTLVTHVISLSERRYAPHPGPSIGIGVGFAMVVAP
jgi:hypothetical protein